MSNHKITIRELAEHLGCSVSTVSRALNDHYSISEAVKAKVRLHAMELGYVCRPIKRESLAGSKDLSVSVVLTAENLRDEMLFRTVICEIERALYQQNISVHFLIVRPNVAVLSQLKRLRPDGVLVFGMVAQEHLAEIACSGFPAVFFGTLTYHLCVPRITINNYMGSYEATRHLLQNGHSRILFLGDKEFSDDVRLRYNGCRDAIEHANKQLIYDADLVTMQRSGEISVSTARLQRLMGTPQPPTAAVCTNDHIAFLLYSALRDLGKSVPQDLSVVGFDNVAQCDTADPPLTSVRIPITEMAQQAVRLLISQIQNPKQTTMYLQLDAQLVPRQSVRSIVG